MIETPSDIIHGIRAGRLSADERSAELIRRAWTPAERTVVMRGFWGRMSLAIEPFVCGIVFALIAAGVFIAPRLSPRWVNSDIVVVAPVFALGFVASAVYTLGIMVAPVRALLHTFRPIYVVDGYVRYRRRDGASEEDSNGYVAVLTDDRRVACEWPTLGVVELPDVLRPALCEFTEYGGVHAIDGRPTGVLPSRMPLLGVGIRGRREIIS